MLGVVVLSLLLQGSASVSGLAITVEDRVEVYPIRGATANALWEQMHLSGPLDGTEGKRFAGKTRWHVAWHYWFRSDGRSCRIDRSDVAFSNVTTLPEWSDPVHGAPGLQAEWKSFIARLREHEAGHRSNGMRAAVAVRRIVDIAMPTADCQTLGNTIDASARAVLARANRADIDYDTATRHGQTQGAVLP